jgi:flagellar assembly protein FliH
MATVISRDAIERHNVEKYSFKVIALGNAHEGSTSQQSQVVVPSTHEEQEHRSEVDTTALSKDSKDSLIESLMQKTDEMSSNFIKLQMRLEQKEEEFEATLKQAKEEAFNEGLHAGKLQASQEVEAQMKHTLELFGNSIQKLDTTALEIKESFTNLKDDLLQGALDIAQEVIQVELHEHSSEVAKKLSEGLIKELQDASKITIKVNPKDFAFITESLGKLPHINIVAESAISEGGVIVISDAGNIDAQISKRFENVKKVALSE